jgi:hypothetical protein
MRQCLGAIVLALMLASTAHATAPPIIPLQGVLTDASGTPISSAVIVQFNLYGASTGGSSLWNETQTITPVDGLFVAYLGAQTSVPLTVFRDNSTPYLGIKVGTDAEMPRVQVGTAPFAGYAQYCGSVAAVDVSALPAAVPVGPLTCGSEIVTGISATGELTCSPDKDTLGDLPCATNQVAKFNGTAWVCANLAPTISVTTASPTVIANGSACASADGPPCSTGVAVGGSCDLGTPVSGEMLAFGGLNATLTAFRCTVCELASGGVFSVAVTIRTHCMTIGQ